MKIKLLQDTPIAGQPKKAGDIIEVTAENPTGGKIGLRCKEWLIEQGKAELVGTTKTTATKAD